MSQRPGPFTARDLHDLLSEFEAELRAAGLEETTIRTYVDRSTYFVRWLEGDYHPRGPNREDVPFAVEVAAGGGPGVHAALDLFWSVSHGGVTAWA